MGKKQHQKDKLYLTTTEWKDYYGGKKKSSDIGENAKFRRLPFFCCSLSMQPFEHPYCTSDGIIFDLVNIVPFLKQYGLNPVNGEKMTAKELIKLNFHKNSNDKYHCPVTFQVFNENTHIMAVKTTGNVFSYGAIEMLNIKASFWKDLLTDEPFTRKDLITVQDPTKLEKFNLADFYHLKKNLKVLNEEEERAKKDPRYTLKAVNAETRGILDELDSTYKPEEKEVTRKKKADAINAAHYSTGAVAASFTSTAMDRETSHEAAIINEDVLRYERLKKKTYIRMVTSKGTLNLELHSDMVSKTCENFLLLCQKGYYNDTVFHRSIRNFMIQGGDPTGTGKGGESAWGGSFKDEMKPNLTHSGRGVLSMANSGPDTNKSQFFITYRSARHLDQKHSVFGRVVGGLDTLGKMEAVTTDKTDKPKSEMKIISTQVFVNPYEEVEEMLKQEREEAVRAEATAKEEKKKAVVKEKEAAPKVFKQGVGKYINTKIQKRTFEDEDVSETQKKKKTKQFSNALNNFSGW